MPLAKFSLQQATHEVESSTSRNDCGNAVIRFNALTGIVTLIKIQATRGRRLLETTLRVSERWAQAVWRSFEWLYSFNRVNQLARLRVMPTEWVMAVQDLVGCITSDILFVRSSCIIILWNFITLYHIHQTFIHGPVHFISGTVTSSEFAVWVASYSLEIQER